MQQFSFWFQVLCVISHRAFPKVKIIPSAAQLYDRCSRGSEKGVGKKIRSKWPGAMRIYRFSPTWPFLTPGGALAPLGRSTRVSKRSVNPFYWENRFFSGLMMVTPVTRFLAGIFIVWCPTSLTGHHVPHQNRKRPGGHFHPTSSALLLHRDYF